MTCSLDRCDVLVVGAGPVGLLLSALLSLRGLKVITLEARPRATPRSRAIGVHPPGLACLAQVQLDEALIAQGVRVRRGRAVLRGRTLGQIDFDSLPAPYDFVLSVPQSTTERLLEARLRQLAPDALQRGHEVTHVYPRTEGVRVVCKGDAGPLQVDAQFVVGCDGRRSRVREAMRASYRGHVYPQRFAMMDLPDDTAFGSEARVFVGDAGLVESFPLPLGQRRWVATLDREAPALSRHHFVAELRRRTGAELAPSWSANDAESPSTFFAERFCAGSFARGRMILAGDAAHVISPIGGQGMNLGWLDACALAQVLPTCLDEPALSEARLQRYSSERRRASVRAARRAELYMSLGFRAPLGLRALCLRGLNARPVARRAARLFTMQGL